MWRKPDASCGRGRGRQSPALPAAPGAGPDPGSRWYRAPPPGGARCAMELQFPAALARGAAITSSQRQEGSGTGTGSEPGRHDQAVPVALWTRPARLGLGRAGSGPAGAAAAGLAPPGAAAAAHLPARGLRLLLPGHRGLPCGHLQRLRGGGGRAAGAHQGGAGRPAAAGVAPRTPIKPRDGAARAVL
ncbi:hypothetical protein Nmel_018769 [Mimus melanotis]